MNKKVREQIDNCDRNLTSSKVQEAKIILDEMLLFKDFAYTCTGRLLVLLHLCSRRQKYVHGNIT